MTEIKHFDMKNYLKIELVVPLLWLIAGEVSIFYREILLGIGINIMNLFIILSIMSKNTDLKIKNALQGITVLILLQIISLSVPQIFDNILLQFILVYLIMLIPIYYFSMLQSEQMLKELDTNSQSFYILIIILMIGATMEIFEIYSIGNISEITYISGGLMTIYLIISMIITLLLSDTKYWGKHTSEILSMTSNSLLPVFLTIVISKLMTM